MNEDFFVDDNHYITNFRESVEKENGKIFLSFFLHQWAMSLARNAVSDMKLHVTEWGGYETAVRKKLAVSTKQINKSDFDIACYHFKPSHPVDGMHHREVLEMSLELYKISTYYMGDIIDTPYGHYIYMEPIKREIEGGHYTVRQVPDAPSDYIRKFREPVTGTVASPRLDSIASIAYKPSRSKLQGLIENGGAMINYQFVRKPGREIQTGDIISLRAHLPRVRVTEIGNETKKGRIRVTIEYLE